MEGGRGCGGYEDCLRTGVGEGGGGKENMNEWSHSCEGALGYHIV